MEELFIKILAMSVKASVCIVLVMLLRLCLRKMPKVFSYALWLIVLIRLLCPVAAESPFGLLPSEQNEMRMDMENAVWKYLFGNQNTDRNSENSGRTEGAQSTIFPAAASGKESGSFGFSTDNAGSTKSGEKQLLLTVLSIVWLAGVVVLCGYSMILVRKLKRTLAGSTQTEQRIYESDQIESPFLFGFFRPRIYLPRGLVKPERSYIIAHEMVHIRRKDYLVKPVFYLAVCIHWFNPLVWASWLLMCRDMEMSCDEAVLRKLGTDIKKEYATALLYLSVGQHTLLRGPLAFGENDTRARIKNILYYKKPVIGALGAALLVLGIAAAVLLTDRKLPEEFQILSEEQKIESTDWLTDWLTCQIPKAESIVKTGYEEESGVGCGGELFVWTGEDPYTTNGSGSMAPEWMAAGGVMRYPKDVFTFEDGTLTGAFLGYNHSSVVEQPRILEGCEEQAVIFRMNHDLYTLPELYEAEQSGHPISENETTVDIWYVGFAREDSEYGYVLFLNGRYYDGADMAAFAKSVHFADTAWSDKEVAREGLEKQF